MKQSVNDVSGSHRTMNQPRQMRYRWSRFALLGLTSAVFLIVSPAAALDRVKFPYSPISYHSLPFLVAYEAKLFERHGLEVDPIFAGASSLIVQSMLAGEADLAGMAGPAVISNVLKGGDVIQVAALVKSFSVPLYVQPAITHVAQLTAKRVGVTRFGSVSHFTAKAILERSNVADAVIVQTGGYAESMTALSTHAIAGAMIPAPQSVVLREKGFRELVSIKQIREMNIRFIEQGVVARRAFAEKNPEVVKRFIAGVYDGLKKIHDDKAFAVKILGKYTKVTRQNMLDESYEAGINVFAKDPSVPPEVFKDLAEQLAALKLIDAVAARKTPLTAYYDNRYVDELERAGFFKRLWQ
jgi:ABC-type nitrate/sulfonate/bicarbonate transport system substrate-binding protein